MAFVTLCKECCTFLYVRPDNESTMKMRVSSRGRGGDCGGNGDQRGERSNPRSFSQAGDVNPSPHSVLPTLTGSLSARRLVGRLRCRIRVKLTQLAEVQRS